MQLEFKRPFSGKDALKLSRENLVFFPDVFLLKAIGRIFLLLTIFILKKMFSEANSAACFFPYQILQEFMHCGNCAGMHVFDNIRDVVITSGCGQLK